jgi:hypothetical protein
MDPVKRRFFHHRCANMKLIDVTRLTAETSSVRCGTGLGKIPFPRRIWRWRCPIEASELVEIFQWSTEEQSIAVKDDEDRRQAAADEIAMC